MRVHLMFPDTDFDAARELPPHTYDLMQDLQLGPVLDAMARGDDFLRAIATSALMTPVDKAEVIRFRHDVLTDCDQNRQLIEDLYQMSLTVLEDKRRIHRTLFLNHAEARLQLSVSVLDLCLPHFRRLRQIAETHEPEFRSAGFRRLIHQLREELDNQYLDAVATHLGQLRFPHGLLLSGGLGEANTGADFVVRSPDLAKRGFFRRPPVLRPTRGVTIPDRDEASFQALGALRDSALEAAASAAAEAVEHVIDFFTVLCRELAFYRCCLNLHDALCSSGHPVCLPSVTRTGVAGYRASRLYDAALALDIGPAAVASDLDSSQAPIVLITGANRGGKSTFLRAIGIAALLMGCGAHVPAATFESGLFTSVHTHFRREEDEELGSGKLDEELTRMADVADHLHPGSLLLSNESFSSTNEREGSQIGEEVLSALAHSGVNVVMVTHLYELAERLDRRDLRVTFLRAERGVDGQRPFHIVPGSARPTSHAMDIYNRLFPEAAATEDRPHDDLGHRAVR